MVMVTKESGVVESSARVLKAPKTLCRDANARVKSVMAQSPHVGVLLDNKNEYEEKSVGCIRSPEFHTDNSPATLNELESSAKQRKRLITIQFLS
ncbi:hypothetical protein TNCV_3048281 [Trichonephila clavipes]|nr:hypothetical protein TNCV_3048281 [Trichonephila clavipes]